ncbi:death-associated protein kinase dapk-1 [Caerostris extrusa]|uniref:Death-associated protein kinase dapk-1 n=1 Tax=Caerostris extrusa TaxID=172846 RepID=A0AAV4X9Y6_CAEEX|nr:death-associated protein kinase dapk-1 [Caerostris extrusa]
MRGHLEVVRNLIDGGADSDVTDKHGCTALHWALRRHHSAIAVILLQYGCNIDTVDNGSSHPYCIQRRFAVHGTNTLCFSDAKLKFQIRPISFALSCSKWTHGISAVFMLSRLRCGIENKDGITSEISALAQGYNEMANLLNRLRNVHLREEYISQLIPSTKPISKIKLKLFGHSGVGKSTFVDSLKCGYFVSWFRRSVGSMSPKLTRNKKSVIELNSSGTAKLLFETNFDTYTHGVDAQHLHISGYCGKSGKAARVALVATHADSSSCHRVAATGEYVSSEATSVLRIMQSKFGKIIRFTRNGFRLRHTRCWLTSNESAQELRSTSQGQSNTDKRLSFIDRRKPSNSAAPGHAQERPAHVASVLRGKCLFQGQTHQGPSPMGWDRTRKSGSVRGERAPRQSSNPGLPKSTSFLEAVCTQLSTSWRKSRCCFPVLPWQEFMDLVHSEVNPLAGEEHMKELIQQLQIMGEVLYIACENDDVVILDPGWLCGTILGYLLSQENLEQARITGIYSGDDIQLLFPEADGSKLLTILEALQLCTECETEGEIEYEFPRFNLVESVEGLWNSSQYTAYGGVRLSCQYKYFLATLFPRLQVNLRRSLKGSSDPDCDLYQWYRGSKYCSGPLEGIITLVDDDTAYEIKVRGPATMKSENACQYCFLRCCRGANVHPTRENISRTFIGDFPEISLATNASQPDIPFASASKSVAQLKCRTTKKIFTSDIKLSMLQRVQLALSNTARLLQQTEPTQRKLASRTSRSKSCGCPGVRSPCFTVAFAKLPMSLCHPGLSRFHGQGLVHA